MFQSVFVYFFVNPLWVGVNRGPSRKHWTQSFFQSRFQDLLAPITYTWKICGLESGYIETETPNKMAK